VLSRRTFLHSLAAGLGAVGTAAFAPKPLPTPAPPKVSPPAFTGQWVEYPISYGPNTTDERSSYSSRAFFERAFPLKPNA